MSMNRLVATAVVGTAVLANTFGWGVGPAASAPGPSRTYTLNADFGEGTANNVVTSTADQLQLDDTVTAFPFIWVALSARGTIAKIDTATGAIKGEYSSTADDDDSHNPSRTTVASNGSVWSGNRNQSSVVHVGLVEAGQCVDRNSSGTIETSTGYGDVLAWTGYGGPGDADNVDAAADECILTYVDTAGSDARHVSVDASGDVWVGDFGSSTFQRLDGTTGAVEVGPITMPCGGYGGLIDGDGVLWSAQSGSFLLRWDPDLPDTMAGTDDPTANPRCIPIPIYGLAFDSSNNIWATQLSGQTIWKVSPDGNLRETFDQGNFYAQGVAVDGNDDVWVSNSLFSGDNKVAHLKNDGTLVGLVDTADPGVPMGAGSTGVSVDAAGKIWTANINSSTATRIDPTRGPIGTGGTPIGIFDLSVDLPGASPYNYSDMTGSTLTGRPTSGSWTVVYDSGIAGAPWGTLDWTADVPATSGLTLTAASSTDGTTFGPAQTATDGGDLSVADGRYLRITATFTRATTPGGESPILYDVTVRTADLPDPPTAEVLYGIAGTNHLVRFSQSDTMATELGRITGLRAGESVVGIDFRPSTGGLYALGTTASASQLYLVDIGTLVATPVGVPFAPSFRNRGVGFDFNPVVDKIRVTSSTGVNLRLDPATGAVFAVDTSLSYLAGDPGAGVRPVVGASGYTNPDTDPATGTTLYDIEERRDVLVIQSPPNDGKLVTVGPLGIDANHRTNLDITRGGTALATSDLSGSPGSRLYSINLGTGAASYIGDVRLNGGIVTLNAFAIQEAAPTA